MKSVRKYITRSCRLNCVIRAKHCILVVLGKETRATYVNTVGWLRRHI